MRAEKLTSDWPYATAKTPPARGDVITVIVNGKRELAEVRFWNIWGLWLRAKKDGVFLWLSLRRIEFNYARKWKT